MEARQTSKNKKGRITYIKGADGITRSHKNNRIGRPISIGATDSITFKTNSVVKEMLNQISKASGIPKSHVIRKGIQLFHQQLIELGAKNFKEKYLS